MGKGSCSTAACTWAISITAATPISLSSPNLEISIMPSPASSSLIFTWTMLGLFPTLRKFVGIAGPIYMTYPTKALAPLMLEDYRKVMVERMGEQEQFTSDHIVECMKKVIAVDIKQTVQVDKDLQIRAYYAGHVLGAAMFYAKVGDSAIVYTGDYNMTPDRHLGAAQIDRLQLDLVITESTYATTVRDSKYAREREFLKAVHKCVAGGGKVLIPTFALGRAQELCILLDDYWERMNLKIPIYFSAGLTIQANMYYKMLISWTSQKVKQTYASRNAFDFKNVSSFDRSLINAPGPCVLFATPGMISGGFSLEVFKQWAPSELNLVTLPGYCVAGTIGHKLMSGKPTQIVLDKDTRIDVRCQIHQLSFSPHTDAKGIMDLVKFLSPKHVILVHGEKPKMAFLKGRIQSELGIQCYDPANNDTVCIPSTHYVKAGASNAFIQSSLNPNFKFSKTIPKDKTHLVLKDTMTMSRLLVSDERVDEGILVMEKSKKAKVINQDELLPMLGKSKHEVRFAYCCPVHIGNSEGTKTLSKNRLPISDNHSWLHMVFAKLSSELAGESIQDLGEHLQVESFHVSVCLKDNCPYKTADNPKKKSEAVFFCCKWSVADEKLAWKVISFMENLDLSSI
ncbi:hypothetical protein L1049_007256 [Liquidambar formosana]|uniref:Beta-Casp domain-containing protein n=1 Tax=Liquidambar formosana TaxID=63359 RepID=A0AAP0RH48_LIQFO